MEIIKEMLTKEERQINMFSHDIGAVDDCNRCVNCEVGSWNAWKYLCPAVQYCNICDKMETFCKCYSW
jgi:hypothetical protein